MTDREKAPEKPPQAQKKDIQEPRTQEINGRGGLDPTRYHDWEIKGKCVDF